MKTVKLIGVIKKTISHNMILLEFVNSVMPGYFPELSTVMNVRADDSKVSQQVWFFFTICNTFRIMSSKVYESDEELFSQNLNSTEYHPPLGRQLKDSPTIEMSRF